MIKTLYKTKFRQDLLFSYMAQIVNIILGFLQVFLINKFLGVEIYGALMIIVASAGMFSLLLDARSSESVTRFFTREFLLNNLSNAKFILFVGFIIDMVFALLLVIIIYFFSDLIAKIFMKDSTLSFEVFLYAFVVFFTFLRGTILGYLQSLKMFTQINFMSMFELVLKNLLLIYMILTHENNSLETILLIYICSSFLVYIYALIIFVKNFKKLFIGVTICMNYEILKEYWHFNLKTFISSSLKAGNQNIDTLLIAYFINAEMVGIYQVIKKILSPINFIIKPFSMLVYPKLIKYFENKEVEKFKKLLFRITSYILLVVVVYNIVIFIGIEYILNILNIHFLPEYNILLILMFIISTVSSTMWWARIFSNVVNPNYSLYMNLFATCYQLSVTIFLVYIFGLMGMLGSIIIMHCILLFYWIKKVEKYV